MATIAFRNSSFGDIGSVVGSQAITLPTGTLSTDYVAIFFGNDWGTPRTAQSTTAPAGWSTLLAATVRTGSNSNEIQMVGFGAPGSIANLTFTNSQTGVNYQQGWSCCSFSGVDLNNPIDVSGSSIANQDSGSITAGAITIATAGAMHLIAVNDWAGGIFSATNFTNNENGHANASASIMVNPTTKSVGSTGTVAITDSAGGTNNIMIAFPFALKPLTLTYPELERGIRGLNRGLSYAA
jgi:hypothetical protein